MWTEHKFQAFETREEARSFARKHGGKIVHDKSRDKFDRETWRYLSSYLDDKFVAAVVWNEIHE